MFNKIRYKKNPLLVACDIYRPAAIEQLKVVGKNAGCEVYEEGQCRDHRCGRLDAASGSVPSGYFL